MSQLAAPPTRPGLARRQPDEFVHGYAHWPAASGAAYQRWTSAHAGDRALAFAAHRPAPQREEHAARAHRDCPQRISGQAG
jgi:hypothetical protein